ncbi:MAG: hypothetical protein AMXMBFR13_28690 [Phycisphaerae bacterium]
MNCGRADELERYYDGELSSVAHAEMEAHVAQCSVCREHLASLASMSALLRAAALTEAAPAVLERLQHRFGAVNERSVRRMAGWMTGAAAALLLAALAGLPDSPPRRMAEAPPAVWQTVAAMPPEVELDDPNTDLVLMAQWMADELSAPDNGDPQ